MMTDEAAVLLGSKLSQTDVSGQISMCYRWLCLETNTKRYCPGPAGLGALFVKHFKINSVKYFLKIFVHFSSLGTEGQLKSIIIRLLGRLHY